MFDIRQRGSTVGREVVGGLTTFMAMSYIIFVQVSFLASPEVGMDAGGVMMATCLSAAAASVLMAVLANYPIALAPGMGENAFFAIILVGTMGAWGTGVGWQMALALTAVAGLVFLALSTVGFRARLLEAIPDTLKSGIAAGIGLFIAVIGFGYGHLVESGGGPLLRFPGLRDNPAGWVALAGLAVTTVLVAFRVRGAILLGILASTGVALALGQTHWQSPVAWPTGLGETAGGVLPGLAALGRSLGDHWADLLALLFVLLFMDLFDTVGTLVGVSKRAGLLREGRLPRGQRALAADAAGTVIGACLGTSTVTSYIESATGVQAGARTGLASLVVAGCMLGAMFFQPVVAMVMGDFGPGRYPTLSAALVVVGAIMMRSLRDIEWDEPTDSIPAFLTMVFIPLSFSIADGIALGLIAFASLKLFTGRGRQVPALIYIFAVILSLRYILPAVGLMP